MATVADVAGRLNSEAGKAACRLPPLLLLTDPVRLRDPRPLLPRLPPGAAVIFRPYGIAEPARLGRLYLRACRRRRILFLVAADVALARRIGADGVHLPEYMAGSRAWARRARPGWLVTAAAHSPAALRRAAFAGADAALLSPVFATASHPGGRSLGVLRFARWCRASPLPVYALGGITAANARRLRGSGACGIAGIGGLVEARDAAC